MAVAEERKKGKEKVKQAPLRDVIMEEAEEAKREAFGADEEFDPSRDLNFTNGHGPRSFARGMADRDQMVIDELLASLPKNQGYYLKLYKEIMPNKFELKERFDSFDTWTDLEMEVAEYVKAMTKRLGSRKWGSGSYRVVVWRKNGMREAGKYPPVDIIVDAGDADTGADPVVGKVDAMETTNEQLSALGNMLTAIKGIVPPAPDPNIQFQALAQAFAQGKGEQKDGNNMMMTMMMTMMTAIMTSMKDMAIANRAQPTAPAAPAFEDSLGKMMGMLKDFGVVGQQPEKAKSLVDQLAELKLLGIDLTKRDDAIDMLAKMKTILGSVTDLVPTNGKVERPGIMEKLIDAIAPHVPKMLGDIKSITDNAALAQALQAKQAAAQAAIRSQVQDQSHTPMEARQTTRYGQPIGPIDRMGAGDAFSEPPDMDPYSGFNARPTDANVGREDGERAMFSSSDFASGTPPRPTTMGEAAMDEARPPQRPVPQQHVPQAPQAPAQPEVLQPAELPPFLQQLAGLIHNELTDAYGALYETLMQAPESRVLIDGIKQGVITADLVVADLRQNGGTVYNEPAFVEKMQRYVQGFINWILNNENGPVVAQCQTCQAQHRYESKGHFLSSPQTCGIEQGGGKVCEGQLTLPVANAQPAQ